ncbi:MAG: hypothetical protein KatS3mg115_0187 [Candidatus Poribacteria bacterium]|nr:MAG: hypothetical protein KatS3mg115_0187 [Candidatus Poribacteria bacterium]
MRSWATTVLCLLTAFSSAQELGDPVWRRVPDAAGATVRFFAEAIEDPFAAVWFATPAGLLRYDGLFRWYRREDGLPSNEVRGLELDAQGRLWIATGNGLAHYHLLEETITLEPAFAGQPVNDIVQTPDGTLWVATAQGLYRRLHEEWKPVPGTEGRDAHLLQAAGADTVWCVLQRSGEQRGELLGVDRGNLIVHFPLPAIPEMDRVTALAPAPEGGWWLGTVARLWRFDGEWTPVELPTPQLWVRGIAGDAEKRWVATDQGLFRYREGAWQRFLERDGLPSRNTGGIFEDRQGRVWLATDRGLAVADGAWVQVHRTHGLPSERIQTLLADLNGGLWVGTDSGLAHFREFWRHFGLPEGLPGENVSSLALEEGDRLWVGVRGATAGLAVPDPSGWRPLYAGTDLPEGDVLAVWADRRGRVWIGSGFLRTLGGEIIEDFLGSVSRLEGEEWQSWSLPATPIAVVEDAAGLLWAATRRGDLFWFDGERFVPEPLPFPAEIRALLVDGVGRLWVGTSDGLLARVGGEWQEHPLPAELPTPSVWSLAEGNDGTLWVGLEGAIAARSPRGDWLAFGEEDGLPNLPVVSLAITTEGTLWAGFDGAAGLYAHRTGRASVQTALVRAPAGVVGESAVLIQFTGGDGVTPPEQMRFSFRVDGGGWSPPEVRREVLLDNLQQGQRIAFEVRAVGRDGRVDPTPARTEFLVDLLPPTVEILRPRPGERLRGSVPIVGTVLDPTDLEGYELRLPGAPPIGGDQARENELLANWDTRTVPDGNHEILLRAWDRLDGPYDTVHVRELRVPVRVDNTPPEARLIPEPSGEREVILHVEAADAELGAYRLEYRQMDDWRPIVSEPLEGSVAQESVRWSVAALHGELVVRLTVIDAAGNERSTTASLTVNNPAALPLVQILQPEAEARLSQRLEVIGTAWDESLVGYRIELLPEGGTRPVLVQESDQAVRDGLLGAWDLLGVPEGRYRLRLIAEDALGYRSFEEVSVIVDRSPPAIVWESPEPGALFASEGSLSVRLRIEGPEALSYRLELRPLDPLGAWELLAEGRIEAGSPGRSAVLSWTPGGREGPFQLRLIGTDEAGNSTESLSPLFSLDGTPPTVQWIAPASGAVVTGRVELFGTATDANFGRYALAFLDASGQWRPVPVEEPTRPVENGRLGVWTAQVGARRLRLSAWDLVGHTASVELPIGVDAGPPTAILRRPRPGDQVAGLVEIFGTADDEHFASYRLEWSPDGLQWRPIGEPSQTPVREGRLGVWEAQGNGPVQLRLTAEDALGQQRTATVALVVVPTRSPSETVRIETGGGSVRLYVPAHGLQAPLALRLNRVPQEELPPLSEGILHTAVRIEPASVRFRPPKYGVLEFRFDPSLPPSRGRKWTVLLLEGDRWRPLGGTVEQTETVRVPVVGGGTYALAQVPEGSSEALSEAIPFAVQPRAFSPSGGRLLPRTYVLFQLRESAAVQVRIFDSSGRLVRRLIHSRLAAGQHAIPWDGRDDANRPVPIGLYLVLAELGNTTVQTTVLVWKDQP